MIRTMVSVAIAAVLLASQASAQAVGSPGGASDAKLEASVDQLARMKAAVKQVIGRIEQAREEKDVAKLNCVNEKLAQMKSFLKVAERADVALREALASRAAGADAELAKIAIARSKVDGLRAASEQCVGQLSYVVDEKVSVEVVQPTNLPDVGGDEADPASARDARTARLPAAPVVRPPPASRWY